MDVLYCLFSFAGTPTKLHVFVAYMELHCAGDRPAHSDRQTRANHHHSTPTNALPPPRPTRARRLALLPRASPYARCNTTTCPSVDTSGGQDRHRPTAEVRKPCVVTLNISTVHVGAPADPLPISAPMVYTQSLPPLRAVRIQTVLG